MVKCTYFSFVVNIFFVLFRNLSETESSIFPTKSLKVFLFFFFTFHSLNHLELMFCIWCEAESNFTFFNVNFFNFHLLYSSLFPYWFDILFLLNTKVPYLCESVSELSNLFYWSVCLSRYNINYLSFITSPDRASLPFLLFSFRISESLLSNIKNSVGVLIGICRSNRGELENWHLYDIKFSYL